MTGTPTQQILQEYAEAAEHLLEAQADLQRIQNEAAAAKVRTDGLWKAITGLTEASLVATEELDEAHRIHNRSLGL